MKYHLDNLVSCSFHPNGVKPSSALMHNKSRLRSLPIVYVKQILRQICYSIYVR